MSIIPKKEIILPTSLNANKFEKDLFEYVRISVNFTDEHFITDDAFDLLLSYSEYIRTTLSQADTFETIQETFIQNFGSVSMNWTFLPLISTITSLGTGVDAVMYFINEIVTIYMKLCIDNIKKSVYVHSESLFYGINNLITYKDTEFGIYSTLMYYNKENPLNGPLGNKFLTQKLPWILYLNTDKSLETLYRFTRNPNTRIKMYKELVTRIIIRLQNQYKLRDPRPPDPSFYIFKSYTDFLTDYIIFEYLRLTQEERIECKIRELEDYVDLEMQQIIPLIDGELRFKDFQDIILKNPIYRVCYEKRQEETKQVLKNQVCSDVLGNILESYIGK